MKIKMIGRISIVFLSVVFLGSPSYAADSGSLAMPSTQEGGTARAMSMGSAVTGLPQYSASLFWNPAGLGSMNDMELGLHHNSGLGESTQETLVFGMPMDILGGFAASLNYVDNGTFEGRDSLGNPTGEYSAGNLGISVGWGKYWLTGFSAGVAFKYNRQTLASQVYSAIAMDIGLLWNPISSLNVGLTYINLPIKLSSTIGDLDSTWRMGVSCKFDKDILVAVSSELKPADGFKNLQAGAEYFIDPIVAVRAGYEYNFTDNQLDGLTGLTAGLGIVISKSIVLDYAFIPYGDLGNSHRFSLTYRFIKEEPVKPLPKAQ